MILSRIDIQKAYEAGEIGFTPAPTDLQWGEASVDLRLGYQFTRLKRVPGVTLSIAEGAEALTHLKFWDTKELQEAISGRFVGSPFWAIR